jgi:hypothetical protein
MILPKTAGPWMLRLKYMVPYSSTPIGIREHTFLILLHIFYFFILFCYILGLKIVDPHSFASLLLLVANITIPVSSLLHSKFSMLH